LVASDDDAPAKHLFAGNFEGQAAARDASREGNGLGSQSTSPPLSNVYETDASLHMYLGLHYPASGEMENAPALLPHENAPTHGLRFPQRVVNLLNSLSPERTNNRALDIGCAVGGASFELARTFDHVDAFDFSESFVIAARQLQAEEELHFRIPIEADIYQDVKVAQDSDITSDMRSKIDFFTGDACRLAEMSADGTLDSYDGVVMSNLICRLPDPMSCLNGLPQVVNMGGVVVMVTPFSWLEVFTPRSKWLGGFYDPDTKAPIRSKNTLKAIMEDRGFEKIHEEEMPLIIREHQRKYQYIISLATGWRRMG
jgi:putative 4-mercaptohistidine N1-methyltranferase